jgi:hypothetical protein
VDDRDFKIKMSHHSRPVQQERQNSFCSPFICISIQYSFNNRLIKSEQPLNVFKVTWSNENLHAGYQTD